LIVPSFLSHQLMSQRCKDIRHALRARPLSLPILELVKLRRSFTCSRVFSASSSIDKRAFVIGFPLSFKATLIKFCSKMR
jgi:hypothetical protein